MAETITIDIPHKLTREDARKRIESGFGRVRNDAVGGFVKFEDTWSGDRLDFRAGMMGQSVVGRLDVLDDHVHLEVDLPGFLAAIAGKVKGVIQREGTLLLEKK
ncbi:polyhydroxyalkanoic acid system family protein [Consotaella salsifontis]|uniref:Putative polyhydroxyalkanoic acid system protein (PHA_gran_rgn) n=1 Tax=Consotaella salsifontis TaxID=1365950 RepID=A0A1T4NSV2_9HYPH|nr:polyhydroxyalkanoic acid system family protein [Consotaella salsifontis]SJZ82341.1 Putative polyhydroxyalkanoic acid system protein (PHA_gran_rgn) [Consotaella salsifontis]